MKTLLPASIEHAGIIAHLSGIERAIQLLNEERARLQAQLHGGRKPGRPRKLDADVQAGLDALERAKPQVNGAASTHPYWSNMSAEERSAEMVRRRAIANAKQKRKSPTSSWWDTATKKQKAERVAKMNAARLAKLRQTQAAGRA